MASHGQCLLRQSQLLMQRGRAARVILAHVPLQDGGAHRVQLPDQPEVHGRGRCSWTCCARGAGGAARAPGPPDALVPLHLGGQQPSFLVVAGGAPLTLDSRCVASQVKNMIVSRNT